MKRVIENFKYLKVLSNCNKKMLKSIIQSSDKELLSCICECILNCMNGNVKLSHEDKNKLKKYKNLLRNLLYKKNQSSSKKKF
jgi:hypothetical protein